MTTVSEHVPAFPRDVGPYIGGEYHDAAESVEVRDPYRRELAARVGVADAAAVDRAVTVATRAQATVAAMPAYERAAVLRRAADLIADRVDALAETITRQTGKVLSDTRRECGRSPWTFRAAATAAERLEGRLFRGDAMPNGEDVTAMAIRQPVGVVAAITPFNAPLNLAAHKIAPAIAAGNAIVVKPASPAPLSAFDLAEILTEAGLPPGAINVLPGGPETGSTLVGHGGIGLITFTGGPQAGEAIRQRAGFRRLLLELGGNSPNLIHRDADVAQAVQACRRGGFANGGQSCNSVQRILVHRDVKQEFTDELVGAVERLATGDPLDPDTEVGPVVSEDAAQRALSWIEGAAAAGARVLAGGTRDGAVLAPTVVADVPSHCRLYCDEIFAPVVVVNEYTELDEAIEMANETPYGLQAGVFTSDLDTAFEAGRRIRAGGVMINRSSNFRLDHLPYGGVGASGLGREGPDIAVEEMTELKVMVVAPSR